MCDNYEIPPDSLWYNGDNFDFNADMNENSTFNPLLQTNEFWDKLSGEFSNTPECCLPTFLNGALPTTSTTGGMSQNASTASLLPMVFPQAISNRNLPFSPLPCQSGLYPPSPGSLTPILPISTYDSGLSFQNLQMQSQLLDFQSSLISNPLLPCGGMIPTGALMVDPNSMNAPTTSTNGEIIADFKQKPLVNQINNGQSGSVNFLPPLMPDLTAPSVQQTNISAGGSLNFRLPDPLLSTSQMILNGLPVSSTGNSSSLSPPSILNSLNNGTST
ncbi:unnamed protein product [Rodentolepis nana]|uniref:Ovule protein n=1 Tax=Rodentolepis nana TaxID=102285 RepID=A0A0R3TCR7_RODNA|nr:unnamed protein product [Rodentolepis nana]